MLKPGKRSLEPFESEKVRLRLLREGDLPLTLRWRNQNHIRRWFIHSDIILPEQHAEWFRKYQDSDDDFVFIVEEKGANYRPVGQVSIYHIDWAAARAEFGRLMIGEPDAAGKGLAFAATQAALQVAFERLGLAEIYLEVYAANRRAISIYEGAGFEVTRKTEDMVYMTASRAGDPAEP